MSNNSRLMFNAAAGASGGGLYDFAVGESVKFSVSRALANSYSSQEHRYGPTTAQVRAWLSGTANGGQNKAWANTYVDCPVDGYQRWTVGQGGQYYFTLVSTIGGLTDQNVRGRGGVVEGYYNLSAGDQLLIAVGQGVPDYAGDHCNGAGGACWVALGGNIATAEMLMVAAGGAGDTSDGGTVDVLTSYSYYTGSVGGIFSWYETSPNGGTASTLIHGQSAQDGGSLTSGGSYLTKGNQSGSWALVAGGGFRDGNLIGGTQSNSTAGYGGFGGGSGGVDESGNSSGGFSTVLSKDGPSAANTSMINTSSTAYAGLAAQPFAVRGFSTTWQQSDFGSYDSYQGVVKVERVS